MAEAKYLLDTHVLLWFQLNQLDKISGKVMDVIYDNSNTILFSQLSLFEIAIKQAINKLPDFRADTDTVYHQAIKDNFTFLQTDNKHLSSYKKVPLQPEHRDPFDRLLIATAYEENAVILTSDKKFILYTGFIDTLW